MSQQNSPPQGALCFESLVEKQRNLLNEMLSSRTPIEGQPEDTADEDQQDKTGQATTEAIASPFGGEKEWISNWRFERVPSTKKPQDFESDSDSPISKSESATLNASNSIKTEEGIFFFERINSVHNSNSADRSSVAYTHVSASSSDIVGKDRDKGSREELEFFVPFKTDDLFADLEAAADSNDDSEISFDDLMDMEVDDDEHSHDYAGQYSALHDEVDEFLNKSTTTVSTAIAEDDDINMISHEDDNIPNYSSPIISKETVSLSLPGQSLQGYTNSPTCVAHHMPTPPLFNSSFAMSSASTRPAFQQMRRMMTEFMDKGSMPRPRQQDMQLPCAEGMDEMYLDTVRKLSASMARSNRTRKSLSIPLQSMKNNSSHQQEYNRVNRILESVESSSRQVDTCLRSVRMMSR